MEFGYTILYVPDVEKALTFYEKAFGLSRRFLSEGSSYGELETGQTALAFAAEDLADQNIEDGFRNNAADELPAGFEIAFVTQDVEKAYEHAVANGAYPLAPPKSKPWGQIVAYVKDLNGILVELASPMG